MRRAYVFRLRPTARQHVALAACVESHRELYNAALQERRDAWSHSKTRVNYGDQSAQLTEIRPARPDQAVWSFSSQQATLRRLNKAFAGFFRRVKAGQTSRGIRGLRARPGSTAWSGPRTAMVPAGCPSSKRVYLQGIGQVKVHLHREVAGRVKTIQIKRQGRRWMLVLSCDDVPPIRCRRPAARPVSMSASSVSPPPATVSISTIRAGAAPPAAGLAAAQQRLQRAKRGSKNRARTAGNRRCPAPQDRQPAQGLSPQTGPPTRGALRPAGGGGPADRQHAAAGQTQCPTPTTPGSFCPTVPGRSPGSTEASVTLAGASSSRFCAPKRKTLGAPGLRSTPGTPPTAAKTAVTQHRRTASPKRSSPANAAVTPPRQTNTPHATSCGLDWPFTPHAA